MNHCNTVQHTGHGATHWTHCNTLQQPDNRLRMVSKARSKMGIAVLPAKYIVFGFVYIHETYGLFVACNMF